MEIKIKKKAGTCCVGYPGHEALDALVRDEAAARHIEALERGQRGAAAREGRVADRRVGAVQRAQVGHRLSNK